MKSALNRGALIAVVLFCGLAAIAAVALSQKAAAAAVVVQIALQRDVLCGEEVGRIFLSGAEVTNPLLARNLVGSKVKIFRVHLRPEEADQVLKTPGTILIKIESLQRIGFSQYNFVSNIQSLRRSFGIVGFVKKVGHEWVPGGIMSNGGGSICKKS